MKPIKSVDLWNDHKQSQSVDPFLDTYYDKENRIFAYDTVIFCPNLIGNYQVINPEIGELDPSICPQFNGGIIFLKDNRPIRLYLCQTNEIVEKAIGHKYGVEDIIAALKSQIIYDTGLTLERLFKDKVRYYTDPTIVSKFTSPKGYVLKNDVVLESADCMEVLRLPTFLNDEKDWEALHFNPDLIFNVGVIAKDFEIEIEHKGYLVGVKRNVDGLVDEVHGKKLYGIALQTGKEDEYAKMVEFAEEFSSKVGNNVSQETLDNRDNIDKALLDRSK